MFILAQLSGSLYIYLRVVVCLSVYLSVVVWRSVYLSVVVCLFIYLSEVVCLYIYLSVVVCLSVYLSVVVCLFTLAQLSVCMLWSQLRVLMSSFCRNFPSSLCWLTGKARSLPLLPVGKNLTTLIKTPKKDSPAVNCSSNVLHSQVSYVVR